MKNITNRTKILIWVFIILITFLAYWLEIKNKNIVIEQVKAELIEAKKPSKIEIQKRQLEWLEKQWNFKQEKILELRKNADIMEQEKLELEPIIREKRKEILGIKK